VSFPSLTILGASIGDGWGLQKAGPRVESPVLNRGRDPEQWVAGAFLRHPVGGAAAVLKTEGWAPATDDNVPWMGGPAVCSLTAVAADGAFLRLHWCAVAEEPWGGG